MKIGKTSNQLPGSSAAGQRAVPPYRRILAVSPSAGLGVTSDSPLEREARLNLFAWRLLLACWFLTGAIALAALIRG